MEKTQRERIACAWLAVIWLASAALLGVMEAGVLLVAGILGWLVRGRVTAAREETKATNEYMAGVLAEAGWRPFEWEQDPDGDEEGQPDWRIPASHRSTEAAIVELTRLGEMAERRRRLFR